MGKDDLKAAAKEFFIDTYLEFYHDQVIDTLKSILAPLSPDSLKQFVAEGTAPPIPDAGIEALKGYEDYLEKLKPGEVFQWLAEARPDLAETLVELGDAGAEYVIKLQHFIIDSIKNPEAAPKPESQMVELHCDFCDKSWPMPKNLAEGVTVCPFCGKGKEEEA